MDKLPATEMRLMKRFGGMTMVDMDHIQNCGSFRVRVIQEKLVESSLRWYGHVIRQLASHIAWNVLHISSQLKAHSRLWLIWIAVIKKDLKDILQDSEVSGGADIKQIRDV